MAEVDLTFVDEAVRRWGGTREAIMPILQAIQAKYHYLPEEALRHLCRVSQITPHDVAGVSTFFSQFRHRPVGRHLIKVCCGTACHVKNSHLVRDALLRRLRIEPGGDTDAGGLFTVQKVACLGCCTLAPVMQIDDSTYGHLTPDGVPRVMEDFLGRNNGAATGPPASRAPQDGAAEAEIRVGLGSCCVAKGSDRIMEALRAAVADLRVPVAVKRSGCVGMCHQTPIVEVKFPAGASAIYAGVNPADARPIVLRHFRPAGLIGRIRTAVSQALETLLTDESWEPIARRSIDQRDPPVAAFLGRQKHIATEHFGALDPTDLEEYEAHDGFAALRRALDGLSPAQVVDEMLRSGARGRGGAGFPTGQKWAQVQAAPGEPKYVICNGDEGDPGAFMDRMILESFPYRVIEGIALAAYAVGASQAYIYVRAEYPLAVRRLREAITRCRRRGLLGDSVLGTGFALELSIQEGGGAFVCGEETALIASLEGRRGVPRPRPPYPAESGLWGRPTLVNNVESFALVPWIIRNGAEAFAALGTKTSKGTKVFALAGKVARGGLIEVPMGVTLWEIVHEIGGGIAGDRRFKAVQIGGPSGGCVPAELAHTPVDFESLREVGAIMGSGGLVVLDESDCMVDIARYFLEFTQNQSCGKCTFCRIGTRRMLDVLERLCTGKARSGDLEELEELAEMVRLGSQCGLGKTAPNPVLSTLRYFRSEYEAHLQGRCPAGKCQALIRYTITEDCIGCTLCAQHCPVEAIAMRPYAVHRIDQDACTRCDTCRVVCPAGAVKVE